MKPLLGDKSELTEADWTTLLAKLGAFECWSAGESRCAVEKLGIKRVREILGSKAKESIAALIIRTRRSNPKPRPSRMSRSCVAVRDLYSLCINFVNFRDFYDGGEPAIFGRHAVSGSTLLHTDVAGGRRGQTRSDGGDGGVIIWPTWIACARARAKNAVVAAFTNGDADNLMVGRNGLFLRPQRPRLGRHDHQDH